MGKWITVHGHHVYLKDADEMDDSLKGKQFKTNTEYNKLVNNGYDDKLANKPWSNAEEKRAKQISDEVFTKCYKTGDDNEFYEEETIDEVEKYEIPQMDGYKSAEIVIHSNQLVYAQNWDEDDRRVKRGGRVQGSTYYTVSDNGDLTDENYIGYKTKADAQHAAMIYMKDKYSANNIKPKAIVPQTPKKESTESVTVMSPAVKAIINKKSKHFTTNINEQSGNVTYHNTQNDSWARVSKVQYGEGYSVMHGNILGDYARDLHGTNGTGVRIYKTAEQAHKRAQEYLVTINRRGY